MEKSLAVSTEDDDERLRSLIRDELGRQNALPVARRTLELLVEAAVEPTADSSGYRVVDRHGETKLRPIPAAPPSKKKGGRAEKQSEAVPTPLTLSDLVAELRENHPDLFGPKPVPREPEPISSPVSNGSRSVRNRIAGFGSAGAHFVETQSALAKTLIEKSSQRRRVFFNAAGGKVGDLRGRLGEQTKHVLEFSAQSTAEPNVQEPPAQNSFSPTRKATVRIRSAPTWIWSGLRNSLGRVTRSPSTDASLQDGNAKRSRYVAIGLAGATALALVAAILTMGRDPSEPSGGSAGEAQPNQPTQPGGSPESPQQTPVSPPETSRSADTTPSQSDPELQPSDETPKDANDLSGVPEVVDTATLRLAGKTVHLFGVEWVRGGQGTELAKYLGGRNVTCQPAPGSSAYLCTVDGRDLSEVVLFNGGGRASPEATPDLAAAEDHARSERLGVWKR